MRATLLAWGVLGYCFAASAAGIALLALVPAAALAAEGDSLWSSLPFIFVMLVFGVVGAVVAQHQPGNPVGWLFLCLALIESSFELAFGYTHYSLAVEQLPGTSWAAWFSSWSSPLSPALIGLAFLVFPDGRLLSRHWRPAAWFCVAGILPVFAVYAFAPGPVSEFPALQNPAGVDSLGLLDETPVDVFIVAILLLAATSMVVRLRRSRGVERQQVKWFAWSASLVVAFLLAAPTAALVVEAGGEEGVAGKVAGHVFAVILCGLPVSAGVAIMRYRLYDIDRLISRTLVYGALTAALVATYLGLVLGLRVALGPVTGRSDLAVALSTLAVAGLFRPLRTRIQALVDRRFYRRRYDAARTLEAFTNRLRAELDLETLGTDLRGTVTTTMQPAHVTLWLRSTS